VGHRELGGWVRDRSPIGPALISSALISSGLLSVEGQRPLRMMCGITFRSRHKQVCTANHGAHRVRVLHPSHSYHY